MDSLREKLQELLQIPQFDPNQVDKSGKIPLPMAILQKEKVIVSELLKSPKVQLYPTPPAAEAKYYEYPFFLSDKFTDDEIIEQMIDSPNFNPQIYSYHQKISPLSFILSNQDPKRKSLAKKIIAHPHFNPYQQDGKGQNSFHQAILYGDQDLLSSLLHLKGSTNQVSENKQGGALNLSDHEGMTPLLLAIQADNREAVEMILQIEGVDLVKGNQEYSTPLEMAKARGHSALVKILEKRK